MVFYWNASFYLPSLCFQRLISGQPQVSQKRSLFNNFFFEGHLNISTSTIFNQFLRALKKVIFMLFFFKWDIGSKAGRFCSLDWSLVLHFFAWLKCVLSFWVNRWVSKALYIYFCHWPYSWLAFVVIVIFIVTTIIIFITVNTIIFIIIPIIIITSIIIHAYLALIILTISNNIFRQISEKITEFNLKTKSLYLRLEFIKYWILFSFKGTLSGLKQFLASESPLKVMKNAFYFTLKAPFVLRYLSFYLDFWSCIKAPCLERQG